MHDPDVLVWDLHLIEIWHREPNGEDSGQICHNNSWKWHIHHWRLNSMPLRKLRRRLLTRCAWCGGRDAKSDPVNMSRRWHRPDSQRWWHGELELLHHDCHSVWSASIQCYCDMPDLDHPGYGRCRNCDGNRAWNKTPTDAQRLLASLPVGSRITSDIRLEVERLWKLARSNA